MDSSLEQSDANVEKGLISCVPGSLAVKYDSKTEVSNKRDRNLFMSDFIFTSKHDRMLQIPNN